MKFEKILKSSLVPEWESQYMNYTELKNYLREIPSLEKRSKGENSFIKSEKGQISNKKEILKLEAIFLKRVKMELEKVSNFVKKQEMESKTQIESLSYQIERIENETNKIAKNKMQFLNIIKKKINNVKVLGKSGNEDTVKLRRELIEKGFQEYYRGLLLLKSYINMNKMGFIKICKKFDKITKKNIKDEFISKNIENSKLVNNVVNYLIEKVESDYVKFFGKGDRHLAMRSLRIPEKKKGQSKLAFFSGFLDGITISILYNLTRKILKFIEGNDKIKIAQALIYFGLGLPIIYLWLTRINLIIWRKYKINYKFILELDVRNCITEEGYLMVVSTIMCLYFILVYSSINEIFRKIINLNHEPIVIFIIFFIILLMPCEGFYGNSRKWLVKNLLKIIFAPFFSVKFSNFFLADIISSLGIFNLTFMKVIKLANGSNIEKLVYESNISNYELLLICFPCIIRIIQCIIRYNESKNQKIHLANMLKYTLACTPIILNFIYMAFTGKKLYSKLILFTICISSLYSFYWDLVMDWGLIRISYDSMFLRRKLLYPRSAYYLIIFYNYFARSVPTIVFLMNLSIIYTYLLCPIEVIRRIIWSLVRFEYEHLNNCGSLRAIHKFDIPMSGDLFFRPNDSKIAPDLNAIEI